MTTFEKLLENYWFVKDINPEEYKSIKNDITDEIQNFIKYKLGYKLIVNQYVIKLEKVPGIYVFVFDFNLLRRKNKKRTIYTIRIT